MNPKRLRARLAYLFLLTSLMIGACGGPLTGYPTEKPPSNLTPTAQVAESSAPTEVYLPIAPQEPAAETTVAPTPSPLPSASPTLLPTATPDPSITFAIIGDFGLAGPAEADVAALIQSWQPDLIITTGDNNYPDGAAETIDANIGQYFHNFIAPYQGAYGPGADVNRFFPTLGNHDWNTAAAAPSLEYFTLPGNERYYDFVWGPVHFFALSSDSREPDGVGRSSVQAQWLQAALAASTAPWQVVYMHHPAHASRC
ncbi:MAG TPA: metallophosphoesterase [Anaerolineales bacterium]|nr:metallophosphoesterase [Anaerolineales bacterium]